MNLPKPDCDWLLKKNGPDIGGLIFAFPIFFWLLKFGFCLGWLKSELGCGSVQPPRSLLLQIGKVVQIAAGGIFKGARTPQRWRGGGTVDFPNQEQLADPTGCLL